MSCFHTRYNLKRGTVVIFLLRLPHREWFSNLPDFNFFFGTGNAHNISVVVVARSGAAYGQRRSRQHIFQCFPLLEQLPLLLQHLLLIRSTYVALRHTATHRNTLQHTAAHCSTLQHTATHFSTLWHTATHCSTLQHSATHCGTLRHTAARCNTLQHIATHCSTLPSCDS